MIPHYDCLIHDVWCQSGKIKSLVYTYTASISDTESQRFMKPEKSTTGPVHSSQQPLPPQGEPLAKGSAGRFHQWKVSKAVAELWHYISDKVRVLFGREAKYRKEPRSGQLEPQPLPMDDFPPSTPKGEPLKKRAVTPDDSVKSIRLGGVEDPGSWHPPVDKTLPVKNPEEPSLKPQDSLKSSSLQSVLTEPSDNSEKEDTLSVSKEHPDGFASRLEEPDLLTRNEPLPKGLVAVKEPDDSKALVPRPDTAVVKKEATVSSQKRDLVATKETAVAIPAATNKPKVEPKKNGNATKVSTPDSAPTPQELLREGEICKLLVCPPPKDKYDPNDAAGIDILTRTGCAYLDGLWTLQETNEALGKAKVNLWPVEKDRTPELVEYLFVARKGNELFEAIETADERKRFRQFIEKASKNAPESLTDAGIAGISEHVGGGYSEKPVTAVKKKKPKKVFNAAAKIQGGRFNFGLGKNRNKEQSGFDKLFGELAKQNPAVVNIWAKNFNEIMPQEPTV